MHADEAFFVQSCIRVEPLLQIIRTSFRFDPTVSHLRLELALMFVVLFFGIARKLGCQHDDYFSKFWKGFPMVCPSWPLHLAVKTHLSLTAELSESQNLETGLDINCWKNMEKPGGC